mmetsp:Transcript_116424/g.324445  ORF Transcript_116424/g.324445 Transcript_116424/m.324445 type:complete len:216 (+) Transcript_116424:591-1238(+)
MNIQLGREPIKLAKVEEAQPWQRGRHHRAHEGLLRPTKRNNTAFLIVVLHKMGRSPEKVLGLGADVPLEGIQVALVEVVQNRLVVHDVKPERLQHLLLGGARQEVIVCLGHEEGLWVARSNSVYGHLPEFLLRPQKAVGTHQAAPSMLDHVVEDQHAHVASDGICLRGNGLKNACHDRHGVWVPIVELQGVCPGIIIRAAAEGKRVAFTSDPPLV